MSTVGQSVRVDVAGRVREALSASTRFADLRHWDSIDSTNRWVREQAEAGAGEGLVAVADHQQAGRGRLGRTWEAPPGAGLLLSVLLQPVGLEVRRVHLLTAAVGLAARQACVEVGGFEPDLKWPNDLLVGERKLAGVLAEAGRSASAGAWVVVGIGLNISAAPEGAVTADEAAGRPLERDDLLLALLQALEARLAGTWDAVAAEHRAACSTVGRRVRAHLADRVVEGLASGLDDDGRLVVRPDAHDGPGPARDLLLSAADVVHLRPAPPRDEPPPGPR